jgi:hypothetical protein
MIRKILIALAGIVVVFVAIVAMQPSEYRVARTVRISASAPAVFGQVNDFHKSTRGRATTRRVRPA